MIEVLSGTDRWTKRKKKIDLFFGDGATYAVAINPKTREIYERGEAPPGLSIDFAAVIDA